MVYDDRLRRENFNGVCLYTTDAKYPNLDSVDDARIGIEASEIGKVAKYNLSVVIAQFFGIVGPGMIISQHIFQGLKRPMLLGENMGADKDMFVYSWKPQQDCIWDGSPHSGKIKKIAAPPNKVFVVIVEPGAHYLGISGTIKHWTWVPEDGYLQQAPLNWKTRYTEKLWSQS